MTRFARLLIAPSLAVLLAFLLLAVALENASASTDEREAIEDIAIVDDAAMESLAAILADPDASPACKGYADLLLYAAASIRHVLEFPESLVARSELSTRVLPSVPASQYACENAV
jgi:hypothetical protein